jgi:hypothetical protein
LWSAFSWTSNTTCLLTFLPFLVPVLIIFLLSFLLSSLLFYLLFNNLFLLFFEFRRTEMKRVDEKLPFKLVTSIKEKHLSCGIMQQWRGILRCKRINMLSLNWSQAQEQICKWTLLLHVWVLMILIRLIYSLFPFLVENGDFNTSFHSFCLSFFLSMRISSFKHLVLCNLRSEISTVIKPWLLA